MIAQEQQFVSEEKVEEQKIGRDAPIFWIDQITVREKLHKHGVLG